ncbi:MAG: radical SAM protein [Bacilli bacterium]|nr:radical SAM protein [Bacilli bacterium]
MKVAFILPGIGKKHNEKYLKSWLMEPLTIAVLNKLLPKKYDRIFYDDRIEAIDYETDADVVCITVETYTAKRAYEIADKFRKKGKIIIMGGYHSTMVPEDVRDHCDIIMRGNAEKMIKEVFEDIEKKKYKKEYFGETCLSYGKPDRSIYKSKMKKYLSIALIETGRGCRHNCEFCSINAYYKGTYHHRRVKDIIEEIKETKKKIVFFVDDSIFSDKKFAKELFKAVEKLHIIWVTQVTLDVAIDQELLRLMRKSGCVMILIGFESIDPNNLKQMNKEWNAKLGQRDKLVENIHNAGISIYASFVFGFDYDTEESFAKSLEFCQKHKFFVAAFNHLLAFPNTNTYKRFEEEKRLISPKWWLEDNYTYGTISYQPKLVTAHELKELCREYKKKFFTIGFIFKRWIALIKRNKNPIIHVIYWYMNILLHFEVDKRIGIPIGKNLDEKIK